MRAFPNLEHSYDLAMKAIHSFCLAAALVALPTALAKPSPVRTSPARRTAMPHKRQDAGKPNFASTPNRASREPTPNSCSVSARFATLAGLALADLSELCSSSAGGIGVALVSTGMVEATAITVPAGALAAGETSAPSSEATSAADASEGASSAPSEGSSAPAEGSSAPAEATSSAVEGASSAAEGESVTASAEESKSTAAPEGESASAKEAETTASASKAEATQAAPSGNSNLDLVGKSLPSHVAP